MMNMHPTLNTEHLRTLDLGVLFQVVEKMVVEERLAIQAAGISLNHPSGTGRAPNPKELHARLASRALSDASICIMDFYCVMHADRAYLVATTLRELADAAKHRVAITSGDEDAGEDAYHAARRAQVERIAAVPLQGASAR